MKNKKVTLNKITKEVEKDLREIEDMLPKFPISAKKWVKGIDLIKEATEEQLRTIYKDIDADKMYVVKTAGLTQAVNHYKRIKSAYIVGGWEAVDKYCEPYKQRKISDEEYAELAEAEATEDIANIFVPTNEEADEPVKKKRGRPKKNKVENLEGEK